MNVAARRGLEVLEWLAVAALSVVACWPLIRTFLVSRPSGEGGGDYWLYVYYLIVGLEKLQGTAPGGLWDAGYFFPTHEMSFLFTEPTLGVTAALYPVWKLVDHDFLLTLALGSVFALVLGWVAAYGFARHFGGERLTALMVATGVGTSSVFLWVLVRPFFWTFPLVLWIAVVLDRACTKGLIRYGVLAGVLMGALGWCSLHLLVMATLLIALIVTWRFATGNVGPGATRACATFGLLSAAIAGWPVIAQAVALLGNGFSRPLAAQANDTPNFTSFLFATWTHSGVAVVDAGLAPPAGEFAIGISPLLWLGALAAFVLGLQPRTAGFSPPSDRGLQLARRRTWISLAAVFVIATLIALMTPDTIGGHAIDGLLTFAVYALVGAAIVLARSRLAAALRRPETWFAFCAGVFVLMCLGPVLRPVEGHALPSPLLPLFRLPGFSGIRVSARWSLMLVPCLATSSALVVQRVPSRVWRAVLALVSCVLMIADNVHPGHWNLELKIPSSAASWQPRPVDNILATLPKPGAVLELPYLSGPPESSRMISRLFHRRPLVNGYGGFEPDFFTQHVIGPNDELLYSKAGPSDASIELLRQFGAKYWVVHLSKLTPSVAARFGETFGPLVRVAAVENGRVAVYEDPAVRGL